MISSKAFFIFLLSFLISFLHSFEIFSQQNINSGFFYSGNNRTYILHVPANYSGMEKVPLVLNLHGYGSSANQQQFYSMMDIISDTAGFLVVYPDAVNSVWDTVFSNSTINDVGFLSVLIDTISKNYNIDSSRVYSTGLSMGGFMTYRLGCELSNRIAAIASVAGPVITPFFNEYNLTQPIPVLHIHGTADSTIFYNGGGIWPSVETLINYFVNKNNCPLPDSTIIPNINNSDSSSAIKYHYGFCDDSSEVIFYKILNGGHTWPGGLINIPSLGNTNRDFNASLEIWDFFKRHRLQVPATGNKNVGFNEKGFQVYPNPNNGVFKLNVSDKFLGNHLTFYNLFGTAVFEGVIKYPEIDIDISGQPEGIYFFQFSAGNHIIYSQKIIR